MGESEHSTPLEIWKIKRGIAQEKESSFVMARGTENEPKIRALYEIEFGLVDFAPATFEHPDVPHYRASLDGWNADLRRIIEIKYSGKENYELAKAGVVAPLYVGQVQYQLFVTGAVDAHFIVFNGEEIAVVHVMPDPAYWARMIPVLDSFWWHVKSGIAPPMTDRDVLELDDPDVVIQFETWKFTKLLLETAVDKEEIKKLKFADENIRAKIKALMPHPRVRCAGVLVTTVNRKSGPTLSFRVSEQAS